MLILRIDIAYPELCLFGIKCTKYESTDKGNKMQCLVNLNKKHKKVKCNLHDGRYFMQDHKDDITLADKISYIRAQYRNCNHHFIPALQGW